MVAVPPGMTKQNVEMPRIASDPGQSARIVMPVKSSIFEKIDRRHFNENLSLP